MHRCLTSVPPCFLPSESTWHGAECLSIDKGASDEDNQYLKSTIIHHYLFGYELPDTVVLLTKDGQCVVLAAKKKCAFLQPAVDQVPSKGSVKSLKLLTKCKEDSNKANIDTMLGIIQGGSAENAEPLKVGVLLKEYKANTSHKEGSNIAAWEDKIRNAGDIEVVDVAGGISVVMAVKDQEELDMLKKSSVLSNKVLKHGFVPKMEDIIDNSTKVTHEKLATDVDAIIEDPSKINLNVPTENVETCYFPIIQSGGTYDFRISATSNTDNVKFDVITVALGARYQLYCSNIVRTFLVDAPKAVTKTYDVLMRMHEACMKSMVPGKPLKHVYASAIKFLRDEGREDLVSCLPKNLGSSVGLDFRDGNLLLNNKNTVQIKAGMVFNLACSFAGLKLSEKDKAGLNDNSAVSSSKLNEKATNCRV